MKLRGGDEQEKAKESKEKATRILTVPAEKILKLYYLSLFSILVEKKDYMHRKMLCIARLSVC